MIAALLLAGLFAVPIATIALFVRTPRLGAVEGAWPATRRMVFAVLMTAGLAAVVAGALLAIGVTSRNVAVGVAGLIIVSVAWLPLTRPWSGRAHVCWSATTFLFAAYLIFMIDWTFASHLGAGGTVGGVILWLLEVFAALLGCAYLWELCDAIGRERWLRRASGALQHDPQHQYFPFVSLHVPAHYEPPDMVIETLTSRSRRRDSSASSVMHHSSHPPTASSARRRISPMVPAKIAPPRSLRLGCDTAKK